MREPRTPMPMFYYCGSKHHGIKSDAVGIEFHLLRLPDHLRENACRQRKSIKRTFTANILMIGAQWLTAG